MNNDKPQAGRRSMRFIAKAFLGLFLLALSFFTVVVDHVRTSNELQLSTTQDLVMTGLQVLVYLGFFIVGWILIDKFDRRAIFRERIAQAADTEFDPPDENTPLDTSQIVTSGVPSSGIASPGVPSSGIASPASESAEDTPADTDKASENRKSASSHLLFSFNAKSIAVTTLLLFLFFVPYLVVFYPGVSSADTANQIKDFVTGTMPIEISWNEGEPMISCFLNDHHPVTDTLIFVFFSEFLGGLLGANVGVFLYCALQALLTAFLMSFMLCSMERFGIPYGYRKAGFLFLGISPFIGLYAIGMLKDSIYSMFFIAYYLVYVGIMLEGATRRRMIGLVLLSLALSLTKKTGTYLVLLCNLPLIFVPSVRKRLGQWAVSWLLPALLVMLILPHVVFPLFNIFPGGDQESLGFTMQMVARTYLDHKEELTQDEVAVIDHVFDVDHLEEAFSSYNYDEVKHLYNFEVTKEQLSQYRKLWLQLFFRYPASGIKALFGTAGGFFSPTERIRVYYSFNRNNYTAAANPEFLEPYRKAVEAAYVWLGKLPGPGIVLQCVPYLWWLPLAVLLRVLLLPDFKGRRMRLLGCLIPIAICVLVLWVNPYSMGRYGLPQFYTLPLVMGLGSRACMSDPEQPE